MPFAVEVSEKLKKISGAFHLREELFISVVERWNDEFFIIQLEKRKRV